MENKIYFVYIPVSKRNGIFPDEAIDGEKYIKGEKRNYKLSLIEKMNPERNGLYEKNK